MALFSRRRRTEAEQPDSTTNPTGESVPESVEEAAATPAAPAAPAERDPARGPWDVSQADDRPGRVDLGAIRIPGRDGMALRMELDRATRRVIAANVTLGQSTIQLQAFAAPRTAGIWDEIRNQIAASIKAQGGAAQEGPGPFGTELLALLPVKDAAGNVGKRPARFLGVDGPRWFLRGVITGQALVDKNAAALIEQYFSEVVVVRGDDPRPPSELLALTMPGQSAPQPAAPAEPDLLTRGPEITEVR